MLPTGAPVSNSHKLQQQMSILINLLISEGFSRQPGVQQHKSSTFLNERKSNEPAGEVLELFKKMQKRVNLLENEFEKVESENLHQDQGYKIFFVL